MLEKTTPEILKSSPEEQSFRLLFDSVTDYAISMLDADGCIVNWNSGAQNLKQYASHDLIGQHFRIFFKNEDQQSGEPESILKTAREKGKCENTGWRVRKDGTEFLAHMVVHPIYNKCQELIGFAKVMRDVSERRQTERKIREGAMLKALVNTAVDGVMMMDSNDIIQMANPACERLFGYTCDEMIGRSISLILPDEHGGNTATGPLSNRPEVMGRRKNGTRFPICLSIGEAKQEGVSVYVGIMHDLSERKKTEEQLAQAQKMETVGQLSGGIAHDFNNLLTVIIGNAGLLGDALEKHPDLRQMCDTIQTAGERGAELTRRLLAFSRRQTLLPTKINCGELAEGMKLLLQRTLSEDIEVRITADPMLERAFADASQLEAALLNLTLNARDAMPLGGHLNITLSNASLGRNYQDEHPEVLPGRYVMIAVTDDGEGMSPEIREHVFEPFFTTKEVGKGSGLGLSMVYGFVKQSNGHVTIYSEPGLGTTVRLYLPAADVVEAKETPKVSRQIVDLSSLRGHETILISEDDPFVRSHAVASLESFGYKVMTATDGREALAKLIDNPTIALLFSDVVMPGGMTGWELAEQAQKHRPDTKILLTSGYPVETLAARRHHNPDISLLNKPYRKIDLGRRLRDLLDGTPVPYVGGNVAHGPQKAVSDAAASSM